MVTSAASFGSYQQAELAYRRERMIHDFQAVNAAADSRRERRTRAAESRAAVDSSLDSSSWARRFMLRVRPLRSALH